MFFITNTLNLKNILIVAEVSVSAMIICSYPISSPVSLLKQPIENIF